MTTYVVTDYDGCDCITAGKRYEAKNLDTFGFFFCGDDKVCRYTYWERSALIGKGDWTVIEESDTPKTWGEMTDAEKGALALAKYHDGKTIETIGINGTWETHVGAMLLDQYAYRIKPEPVVGEVVLYGGGDYGCGNVCFADEDVEIIDHTLTLPTLDGKLVTGEFTNEDGMKVVIEEKQK